MSSPLVSDDSAASANSQIFKSARRGKGICALRRAHHAGMDAPRR